MLLNRRWAMPSADTFSVKPIADFVNRYLEGISVDPFARNSGIATYTNDLNPETNAQHHMQANDFLDMLIKKNITAKCVIFDPPYSPRQITECYQSVGIDVTTKDTQSAVLYKGIRARIRKLCDVGSVVLSFGWNSVGMGNGFDIEEILLVCHGGAHNDTICMAERMIEKQDELF